jgi:hypothetical protein
LFHDAARINWQKPIALTLSLAEALGCANGQADQTDTGKTMSDRARQKKIEKQKKKRLTAQRQARAMAMARSGPSLSSLMRLAPTLPFGPAALSQSWLEDNLGRPSLVTAVITRKLSSGDLLTAILLIDRTCFGVKNAMVKVMGTSEMRELNEELERMHGGLMDAVPLETALSVVWHAIDFARSLGFEPHRDFPEGLIGPRPDVLVDTPLSKPARPVFIPGPHDGPARILQTLTRIHKGDSMAIGQSLLTMGFTPDIDGDGDDDDDFADDDDSYEAEDEDADADADDAEEDTAKNDVVDLA